MMIFDYEADYRFRSVLPFLLLLLLLLLLLVVVVVVVVMLLSGSFIFFCLGVGSARLRMEMMDRFLISTEIGYGFDYGREMIETPVGDAVWWFCYSLLPHRSSKK